MGERKPNTIRVKVMCLFTKDGKTLGARGYDDIKKQEHFRIIGGSLYFNEKAEDGIRREVKEELNCDIENLELIDVIENLYTYSGNKGHDVVFLYKGDLSNKELYNQEKIIIEEEYDTFEARWIPVQDILSGEAILYPDYDWSKVFK